MNLNSGNGRPASSNKAAKPTGAPPNFVPNQAQAIQVDTYGAGNTQQSKNTQGSNQNSQYQGNSSNGKYGYNKHGNQNNKHGNSKKVDPGAVYPCLYHYVYIWPRGRKNQGYWMYVTYVGPTSVAGWRFNGRYWVYYSTSLRQIESFYCY